MPGRPGIARTDECPDSLRPKSGAECRVSPEAVVVAPHPSRGRSCSGHAVKTSIIGWLLLHTGLLLSAPASAGDFYKWVDEDGVTHYSEQPPASDDASQVDLDIDEPSADEVDRARKRLREMAERNERLRKEREAAEQSAAKEDERIARREKRCNDMRSLLGAVNQAATVQVPDGQGGTRYLSDEERDRRVNRLQARIDEECR